MLDLSFFHQQVPQRPMGRYAHVVLLRETNSYALFQTDSELNTARVPAGVNQADLISRITMFKRKQTTPERLAGRELLRRYELISGAVGDGKQTSDQQGLPICDYNVRFCMQCPDCISYGFAIGDSGSEKSKIYSDTAYSLTPYDISHEAFTLNAPYESGTMSRQGEVTSRINEQDHVRPQIVFPAIITFRDPTAALFAYVLNNILRTRRYGAQTTRTGTISNHILAIVLADGELFSNLLFTQRLYDALGDAVHSIDPVQPERVLAVAQAVFQDLLNAETVKTDQILVGTELARYVADFSTRTRSDEGIQELLQAAFRDSQLYYQSFIEKDKKKKK